MTDLYKINQFFQLGRLYVREGRLEEAHQNFLKAIERLGKKESREVPLDLISFYGMTLALVGGNYSQGLRLCRNAASDPDPKPEYFLNLGKVYIAFDQKAKGIRALYQGLRIQPRHSGIIAELRRLGKRRPPIFKSLSRRHLLNRYSGILLRRNHFSHRPRRRRPRLFSSLSRDHFLNRYLGILLRRKGSV